MGCRLVFIAALITNALTQFVSPPTDLKSAEGYAGINVRYKQVPNGICELNPNVKSYAGYSDIAENQHIFWWFFEARKVDPKTAPLTVWINGGPGSSSMIGQWQELGPCFVNSTGDVYNNPNSFSEVSNMIFIDHPAQVGFSYSVPVKGAINDDTGEVIVSKNGACPKGQNAQGSCGTYSLPDENDTANSTANAAPGFWKTLQGFMGVFPEYSRNEFAFTTESYGGHYGPVFSEYIEEQNRKGVGHPIHLKSLLIGNGWYDPLIQYQAYYNFTVSPGNTYDYSPFNKTTQRQMYNALYGKGNCVDGIKQCYKTGDNSVCSKADSYCASNVEELLDDPGNRDEYDIRELYADPFPPEFYVDYLNTEKVQKAIGAFVNYTESSAAVGDAFGKTGDDGREANTIEDLQKLIKDGVTVIMYTGDADYNCNWLGGEVVSTKVCSGITQAGYTDVLTSDGIVHGQVRQADNFAFLRIYQSGHEVPFYQPVIALEMFERAINGKDIRTGKKDVHCGSNYLTKGTSKSTYREGIRTVQFTKVPVNDTYNIVTGEPNPYPGQSSGKPPSASQIQARKRKQKASRMRWTMK